MGTAEFFENPLLSKERVKLRTSNLARTFIFTGHRVYPNKSPLKIWEKKERGRIQGLPNFLSSLPVLSQERVKLRTSNLVGIFTSVNQSVNHKSLCSIATSKLELLHNAVWQSRGEIRMRWIRLAEEPWLEMPSEWRQRLSWRRLRWQGVPDAWSSNRESPATDGREPHGRHHNGPCKQKPLKNLGEKGAWAYPETAQIFWVPPIFLGTGKAANFKFGKCIHSVHANKSPLLIWEKRERGCIQRLPNFFEYSLFFYERVKLRTSNLASVFTASMWTKAP